MILMFSQHGKSITDVSFSQKCMTLSKRFSKLVYTSKGLFKFTVKVHWYNWILRFHERCFSNNYLIFIIAKIVQPLAYFTLLSINGCWNSAPR